MTKKSKEERRRGSLNQWTSIKKNMGMEGKKRRVGEARVYF